MQQRLVNQFSLNVIRIARYIVLMPIMAMNCKRHEPCIRHHFLLYDLLLCLSC
jgi:hypothetical protein